MKRLLIVAAIAVIAAPALAGSDILPIDGVGYLRYDVATGQVTPVTAETRRLGPPIWEASYDLYVNYFWGADPFLGEGSIDWADVATGVGVGGLGFSEFTNSQEGDGDLYAILLIYQEENGEDSGRDYVAGYLIDNIPGSTHPPDEYWGYIWGVELFDPFVLDGSDLDGDGLTDWGYFQFFSGQTPASAHGPGIAGLLASPPWDPNNTPPECPGVEDNFCLYQVPAWNNGPNNIDPNNLGASVGCNYWFGGGPPVFAQFHFVLYAPVCPNRGESGRYCSADIDGSFDCIVGLGDLAQLLGNYGCDSGDPNDPNFTDVCTLLMGDIDPYDEWWPGDGDVDLGDLAELLGQYGDDCTEP